MRIESNVEVKLHADKLLCIYEELIALN